MHNKRDTLNAAYKSIAIVRLSSLGDIIHTLPAFSILRRQFPQAKISWLVEPPGARLLKSISGIDEIIEIKLKSPGAINKIKEVKRVITRYRHRFDLILDFQGLIKSAVLSFLLGGRNLGFHKRNLREPQAGLFYKEKAQIFDEEDHVIHKNIHLVHQVTNPGGDASTPPEENIRYSLKDNLEPGNDLQAFLNRNKLRDNDFIILNVGGAWETKLMSVQQYVKIIAGLKDKYPIVILWGNQKEKRVAEHVASKTGVPISIFLNFNDLIAFVRSAALVITADTLALHISDIVQTPSIGIFGPTSPRRNGSLLDESVALHEDLNCKFCYKKKCGTIDCVKKFDVNQIIRAVENFNEKRT